MPLSVHEVIRRNLDAEELNLEGMHISALQVFVPLLSKMPRLRVLRLANNDLDTLPDDLSVLSELETLDLSDNPIKYARGVIPGLLSLPNLRHLMISFNDQREEDELIISLSALQSFNGTALGPVKGEGSAPAPPSVREGPHSNFWESAAELHATLRSAFPFEIRSSETYFDFKDRVAQYVSILTAGERDEDVQRGEILKARRVLADYCFDEAIAAVNFVQGEGGDSARYSAALSHVLTNLHQHYAALLDDYDQQWRGMAHKQRERAEGMRLELCAALHQVEDLMAPKGCSSSRAHDAASDASGRPRTDSPSHRASLAQPEAGRSVSRKTGGGQRSESVRSSQNRKVLTLPQLLDFVENIYNSKEKYDQVCMRHGLPRETVEQHMYTYLNQRYGLREIIVDYATAIVEGIKRFSSQDNDAAVFAKILRNDIDENFRFVQREIRAVVPTLLRVFLKKKFPLRSDQEIQQLVAHKMETHLVESEWKFVAEYMYAPNDAAFLVSLIEKDTAGEVDPARSYPYKNFIRLLLDFQLDGHQRFLKKFVTLFRSYDHDKDGVVSHDELMKMLLELEPNDVERRRKAAAKLDGLPELLTFSEAVSLFAEEIAAMAGADEEGGMSSAVEN